MTEKNLLTMTKDELICKAIKEQEETLEINLERIAKLEDNLETIELNIKNIADDIAELQRRTEILFEETEMSGNELNEIGRCIECATGDMSINGQIIADIEVQMTALQDKINELKEGLIR